MNRETRDRDGRVITPGQPTPDECQNCGGQRCVQCDPRYQQSPPPDYIRDQINRWRPAC